MRRRGRSPSQQKLARARERRREATAAERAAWAVLRNRGLLGLKFRRQHVLAGFVVDFYCAELRAVLEIDGPVHYQASQAEYDFARTKIMHARGVSVVRIPNQDVSRRRLEQILGDLILERPPSPRSGEGVRG